MIEDVGARIRNIRKMRGITLTVLSQRTGLSVGHLSNLERNMTSPTLDNIQQICSVLDVSLVELLQADSYADQVVRRGEREVVFEQEGQVRYEAVRYDHAKLDAMVIYVAPHCAYDEEWRHDYDELGFVVQGTMTIRIDTTVYTLERGDSFYIRAGVHHNIRNLSDEECVCYWVKMGRN